MLEIRRLPEMVFCTPEGESALQLSREGPRLAAIVDQLRPHHPDGQRIGLIFRTSPELILTWLAVVAAGLTPIILAYPTEKLNKTYWWTELDHGIGSLGLDGIVCAPEVSDLLGNHLRIPVRVLQHSAVAEWSVEALPDVPILQQSSGTTGPRKGIAFPLSVMGRHVELYDQTMELGPADCIVSWLPLYHDMGFIACFLMPLFRGIKTVMIDPITWVRNPQKLFEAIARHRGTVCYMPNFGYRVMTAQPVQGDLRSMRCWVSMGEPVVPRTIRAFLDHIKAPADTFKAGFGMAESVFAITQSRRFEFTELHGRPVTSCGRPIPGVQIQIRDGEIFVKSQTALVSYCDGTRIVEADGFYATGDLGEFLNGQLYVLGRKRDLLIQAGAKWMLSDLDTILNDRFPEVRGRAVCTAMDDPILGTQVPVFLIEHGSFFRPALRERFREGLASSLDLEHFRVEMVPPGFITKTSSGKMNRKKSLADWESAMGARKELERGDPAEELQSHFGGYPQDVPVGELFDSLALVVLRLMLDAHGQSWSPSQTLSQIRSSYAAPRSRILPAEEDDVLHIVSLADGRQTQWWGTTDILSCLSREFGCSVHYEHLCMPPSAFLLHDLVFHDYFLPRQPDEAFVEVRAWMDKIKRASILIADDAAEMDFATTQIYPVLNHDFTRNPEADLLSLRWQRYSSRHHQLPVGLMMGRSLPEGRRKVALAKLSEYLDTPIFRMASLPTYRDETADWEYQEYTSADAHGGLVPPDPLRARDRFLDFARNHRQRLRRTRGPKGISIVADELIHFCSVRVKHEVVDEVLKRFDKLLVFGPANSVPYLRKRAAELGKTLHWRTSQVFDGLAPSDWECIVMVGAWGELEVDKPVIQLMTSDSSGSWCNQGFADLRERYTIPWAPPEVEAQLFLPD